MKVLAAVSILAVAIAATALAQEKKNDREAKVRGDKDRVGAMDSWIYDDLPRGIEEAKKTGKPLLVVFRCIPCEACAKLDEDVVTRDPVVAKQLDKFVCVRIPHMNGVDLSLFQFDFDQSWAAFLMNADLTIYGRYGTRSSRTDSADDVSLEGFSKALDGALELHAKFPEVRKSLAAKRGDPLEAKTPEDFPSFGGKFNAALDYAPDKKVVPSCIHCHQVGEAERRFYRDAGKEIPREILDPYPNPRRMGLELDPKERARVKSVVKGSPAEKEGFLAGDDIVAVNEVPILSIADLQWIFHGLPRGGVTRLGCTVRRGGKDVPLLLPSPGPKSAPNIWWRATSWDLRRMTTGGMQLEPLPAEQRTKMGIEDGAMALLVKHVGQYGDHAAAKNAGFRQNDVIVAADGKTDLTGEAVWMIWFVNAKKPGDKIPVKILRGEEKLELTLPIQ